MTLAEQAERMAERLEAMTGFMTLEQMQNNLKAAALLRQCAEALRKEGV
jgi:hypothetical protein